MRPIAYLGTRPILRGQRSRAQFVLSHPPIMAIMLSRAGRASTAGSVMDTMCSSTAGTAGRYSYSKHRYSRYSYSLSKKPKHLERIGFFQTPPIEIKITSDVQYVACMLYITQLLSAFDYLYSLTKKKSYGKQLLQHWTTEISNIA